MSISRTLLKRAILSLLDGVAQEQSPGHQDSKAARYRLTSEHGAEIEIMFEKNDTAPPNLWCLECAAGAALIAGHDARLSRAADLWAKRGRNGEPLYGRHSGLRVMAQLGEADLVCLTPSSLAQVGQIIDRLWSVTPAEIA
jgi:hypothetical protein